MTKHKLHICILSVQILSAQKIGGFGSITRQLAVSLVEKGYRVTVVVWHLGLQIQTQQQEGYTVLSIPFWRMVDKTIFQNINADIYHSQNPSILSRSVQIAEPYKVHIVICVDPRNLYDWWIEFRYATGKRRLKLPINYLLEESFFVRQAVQKSDLVGVPAWHLIEKTQKLYALSKDPIFFPNIEIIPEVLVAKPSKQSVCFVGRLDGRKRPEIYIDLAKHFPEVTFNIVGFAEDAKRQNYLTKRAAQYPNIVMHGYVDKFDGVKILNDVYKRSQVLINTSAREGLPITFIEAASHGCAILSNVNPDNFTSEFGLYVPDENFKEGLIKLLANDTWKEKGVKGYTYVKKTYDAQPIVALHENIYRNLVQQKQGGARIVYTNTAKYADGHVLSVIIPTIGRTTLPEVIEAFKQQTRVPDEIIVVHDTQKKGSSWARNRGYDMAKGDLIAYMDDDGIPSKTLLSDFITALDFYKTAGAGGGYQETDILLKAIDNRKKPQTKVVFDTQGLVGIGGNTLYHKSWLEKVKLPDGAIFNESMRRAEDWELVHRLKKQGATFVYVPTPLIHLKKLTSLQYLRHQFDRGRGVAALDHVYRVDTDHKTVTQQSLLWSGNIAIRWIRIILYKVIGPFDYYNFPTFFYFLIFWFGQKTQGLGFIYERVLLKFK